MAGSPKLIVLSEKLRGKTFELTKDIQSAGGTEEKDICIKDPTISSHHCDFVKTEKSYILRDNQSTNGTRVNNVPITEQKLENSDIIQLGGVEILYDCDYDDTASTMGECVVTIKDLNNSIKGLSDFSPFTRDEQRKGGMVQKILIALVPMLTLASLILLVFTIVLVFRRDPSEAKYTEIKSSVIVNPTKNVTNVKHLKIMASDSMFPKHTILVVLLIFGFIFTVVMANYRRKNLQFLNRMIAITEILKTNSVYYTNRDNLRLQKAIICKDLKTINLLKKGFNNIIIIDCQRAVKNGVIDWRDFCDNLLVAMSAEFGIKIADSNFHMEDINQILKDEDCSLFCFANIQFLSEENFDSLRGFTQEKHKCLFTTTLRDYSTVLQKTIKI